MDRPLPLHLDDPRHRSARLDRWELDSGGPLRYAPPLPRDLGVPGFWDECAYEGTALPRLLAVSFVLESTGRAGTLAGPIAAVGSGDEGRAGTPAGQLESQHEAGKCAGPTAERPEGAATGLVFLDPYLSFWYWYPDRIEAKHYLVERHGLGFKQQSGVRIFLIETRRVDADGSLRLNLRLELLAGHPAGPLHVVAWTVRQDAGPAGASGGAGAGLMIDDAASGLTLEYTADAAPLSSGRATAPQLDPRALLVHSPLGAQLKASGRLADESDGAGQGVLHAGMHWAVTPSTDWELNLRVLVGSAV